MAITANKRSLTEIKKLLRGEYTNLKENYGVKELSIFGSYVRGEEKQESDIDILVDFSEPIGLFKFLELEEFLSVLLGLKVDLVSKKALKPYIGKGILQEAISI